MNARGERRTLKALLDLADELFRVRRELEDGPRLERSGAARSLLVRIGRELRAARRAGRLGALLRRYRLGTYPVVLVLELLRRRLHGDDPHAKGRELLAVLFESSFEKLQGLHLLAPGAQLLAAGIVVCDLTERTEGTEVLDLRFRLSDRACRFFLRLLRPHPGRLERLLDARVRPYPSPLQHLMDLRRLALLYQKRAARVFQVEEWDELGVGLAESIAFLNRQIPRFAAHVRACLEATPGSTAFPLVRMARGLGLDEDHLMILVTLLFQELAHGNPYLDATDLLKLVSASEQELLTKRTLFAASSPLRRFQLVGLEEVLHDKPLSAEVYLPNRVVEAILGGQPRDKLEIDADSQIEFHEFLRRLESSDDFFRRL